MIAAAVMRLDDKLAALDNHAARRMRVSEWQHLRTLAAAEGDARIVEECDYRIAKLTARTDGDFGRANTRLAAKLAEAKRLGMEACDLADEATGSASEAPDCGEQVADYRQRCAAIAAALEAL